MTKYFIKANDNYPDSAHNWYLRRDQFTIGELWIDKETAQWIADALQKKSDDERRERTALTEIITR